MVVTVVVVVVAGNIFYRHFITIFAFDYFLKFFLQEMIKLSDQYMKSTNRSSVFINCMLCAEVRL